MENIQKFDRYCQELQSLIKSESLHSGKVAILRKKIRKMIILVSSSDIDISRKIENFWKIGYYLPINKYLKNSYEKSETNTLLTMFSGELYELLSCAPKYSGHFNLYLGDLHRYMSETNLQRELAEKFYAKSIEINQDEGRAFNMLAILKPGEQFAAKARLFILSLLAKNPYNSEQNLTNLIEEIQLNEVPLFDGVSCFADFINLTVIRRCPKNEHREKMENCGVEILKYAELYPTSEIFHNVFSACTIANIWSLKFFKEDYFIHSFEELCKIFTELLQNEKISKSILLVIICEWFTSLKINSENVQLYDSLPMFTKKKWEQLCDVLCDNLNKKSSEFQEFLSKNLDNWRIDFLLNGPKSNKQSLAFWCQEVCQMNNSEILLDLNKSIIFERKISNQKKIEIPNLDSKLISSTKIAINWKPIYVLIDLTALLDSFEDLLKVWRNEEFVYTISSKVLAILDKTKDESVNSRRAIREVHHRQKQGTVKVIEAKNLNDCCLKIVESIKKIGFKQEQLIAVLVDNVNNFKHVVDIPEVSIYSVTEFYSLCNQHHDDVR